MHRFLPLALLALPLFACRSAVIDRQADEKLATVRARTDAAFVYTSCEGGGVGAGCGLILKHTAKDSFREKFRDRVCAEKSEEDCQGAFNRFVDAQLARRYYAADWKAVALTCDLHPTKCDDPVAYELLLVDSHNDAIRDARATEENQIEDERRARQAAHQQAQLDLALGVVNEIDYATHKGPKCRSYPSILTGATLTTCTP